MSANKATNVKKKAAAATDPATTNPPATQAAAAAAKVERKRAAAKADPAAEPPATAQADAEKDKAAPPAADAQAGKAPKVEKVEKAVKEIKAKKPKLVRDSFTMPENDYAQFAALKKRCLGAGIAVRKSEILRAALAVLAGQDDATVAAAIRRLEIIKTGRPSKGGK